MNLVAGLLPFYIELYDESNPEARPIVEEFYGRIVLELAKRGVTVLQSPLCRVESEFREAITHFETSGAQVLFTIHLAYSPSLESELPLLNTNLPLIVLDTTPNYAFDHSTDPAAIMYNHGIHGVQDMCNLLKRNGKSFSIFAGHYLESDVFDRAVQRARAVSIASHFRNSRVGLIGEPFVGMGDFRVERSQLENDFGIRVVDFDWDEGEQRLAAIPESDINSEYEKDKEYAKVAGISKARYRQTERVGLAVRRWIESKELSAFSINFQEAGRHLALPTMPFSEACKAMSRGIGYAGEGDVMTAALVGALLHAYPDTTFSEMFCPDWKGGTIFLSHMGELNLRSFAATPRMIIKDFPFAPGFDPCCLVGHYKAGKACIVNLAPMNDHYTLLLAEGEMMDCTVGYEQFGSSIAGWFKPNFDLSAFLESYSNAGGTHHGAVVYGASAKDLQAVAPYIGAQSLVLGEK